MNKMLRINLPDKVSFIIDKLTENGYEAFAVGGCVRDTLLGRTPSDWDITTSANPADVKKIFRRTIDTGIEHGTVTVMIEHEGFEVTTYRIDGEYEDGRHPKEVIFTPDIREDLRRRDFTINAMAYNNSRGIVDEFGGIDDLKAGIVRCVGNPDERFNEDALRILRAVRFAAQLDFEIDKNTSESIKVLSQNLTMISKERIQVELDKLLLSDNPGKLVTAYELGITQWILPEFDNMMKTEQNSIYHMYNVGNHTIKVIENIRNDHYLRWAALLHDIGKPLCQTIGGDGYSHFYAHGDVGSDMAVGILKGLKFDNKTVKIVSKLVKYHDCTIRNTETGVRKMIVKVGKDIFPYLLELKRADLMGKSQYSIDLNTPKAEDIREKYEIIKERGDCLSMKEMAVNGRDLIEWGLTPGEEVGKGLDYLFNKVVADPKLNNKDTLKTMLVKSFT